MDFSKKAQELHNQVRGLYPWPAATTQLGDVRCKILATRVEEGRQAMPGTVIESGKEGLVVACGTGALRILELQPDGGRRMAAADYLRGHPLREGLCLLDRDPSASRE